MDNVLYKEDKEEIDAWINKYMDSKFWTISVFEALKNSCKRSRQNFKTLTKDLFRALLGKKKKNKNKK